MSTNKFRKDTLFLVLKDVYYQEILSGLKRVEYRRADTFWKNRLSKYKKNKYKFVVFQSGYSNKKPQLKFLAMIAKIKDKNGTVIHVIGRNGGSSTLCGLYIHDDFVLRASADDVKVNCPECIKTVQHCAKMEESEIDETFAGIDFVDNVLDLDKCTTQSLRFFKNEYDNRF